MDNQFCIVERQCVHLCYGPSKRLNFAQYIHFIHSTNFDYWKLYTSHSLPILKNAYCPLIFAPAGFRPRGWNPRRHPYVPRVKKKYRIVVLLVKYPHCTPITPSRRTKVWKDAATVRAIGVPNIAQRRSQPPPGEAGGAKLKRHFHRTP